MPIFSRYTTEPFSWLEKLADPEGVLTRKKALSWVLVFASYLLTAQIGIYLYRDIGTSPALIWPPVGIALSAVLLEGTWIVSAIACAAFCNGFMAGSPAFIIAGSVVANSIQPLVGGYILRKLRFNSLMNTLRDVFLLASVALLCTAIMPLINYGFGLAYNALFQAERPIAQWTVVWIGGALSALVLTPFLARWIGRDIANRTKLQQLEVFLSVLLVVGLSYILFATPNTTFFGTSILLLLIGALFWISFRVGPRVMSLALLLMTSISLAGALYGIHSPESAAQPLSSRLVSTEMFDLILAFFFFLFVSVEEQRKEAIRKLNQDAERLENALQLIRQEDKAKNDFIATLAHELRNPLAPVMSGLELLGLSEQDSGKLEIIESAKRQSLIMRRLLDELLDVARVSKRTYTLNKEEITLQTIIRQSVQATEHFLKERKHAFELKTHPEEIWVLADPVRLTQVFTNILYNAGKYTEPGGRITLSLSLVNESAEILIQDNGIGITEHMLTRIFEPFVQDNRHSGVGTGLGIGLSIAKRMVELHEGSIEATSAGKEKGSTFKVRLPIITKKPDTLPQSRPLSLEATTILLIDDNKDAAASLGNLLRMRGHTVSIAHSGSEALLQLRTDHKVAFVDIGLPDMNGHDVAREIRKKNPHCLIVALSGYGSENDKRRSARATMDAHITKPASLSDIENALATRLKKIA